MEDKFDFKDVKFMSAKEKQTVLNAWKRFIKSGFSFKQFSKALYNHLVQHCNFIAHYNRSGFWGTYFQDPEDTQKFLNQFDRSKGCVSIEYGMDYWIQGGNGASAEYYDINNAIVDALEPLLPQIRKDLRAKEIEQAEAKAGAAQNKLAQLKATS